MKHLKNDTVESTHLASTMSYVIGFILSLLFTLIPYYLVTRQIITGTPLLVTILGFAVIQMFVQIFFFLHLGRGPKPLYNVVFFFATAGLIVLVVGASLLIMGNLYRNMSPEEVTRRLAQEENIAEVGGKQTGACRGNNANHVVTIKGNQVSPNPVVAKRCDTLTFVIEGTRDRELVLSPRDDRGSYGGLRAISVSRRRGEIITLNETGDFRFYDPSDRQISGYFTVVP